VVPDNAGEDSYNILPVLMGSGTGGAVREATVHHSSEGEFSIRQGRWKLLLHPGSGGNNYRNKAGYAPYVERSVQLYDLAEDPGETVNLAGNHTDVVASLTDLLERYVNDGRSTPGPRQTNDTSNDWKQLRWMKPRSFEAGCLEPVCGDLAPLGLRPEKALPGPRARLAPTGCAMPSIARVPTIMSLSHNASAVVLVALIGWLDPGHHAAFAQAPGPPLSIRLEGDHTVVTWTGSGSLLSSASVTGCWQYVTEPTQPFVVTRDGLGARRFFRTSSRWSTRAMLPDLNSEFSVAELNRRIYVCGGYPADRVTVRTVQVYDADTDQWSHTTPLPIPLNHSMAAAVNGKLYVIGGQTDASGSGNFVNTVFEFNPVTALWTTNAPMPTARSSGAAAVIGDLIYIAGGRPPRGHDFAVYDTRNNHWETLPELPTDRNHLTAAALDGKVHVVGGRFGSGFTSEVTDALEIYDPATRTWNTNAMRMPTARGGVNGVAANGWLYVFGGEGNDATPSGLFPQMEAYDPAANRWHALPPLPIPVHGVTGSAFVDGWIHLPGGGTSEGGSSGSRLHQVFHVGVPCE
jgi:N-acetylneuraminic acid mutarotase